MNGNIYRFALKVADSESNLRDIATCVLFGELLSISDADLVFQTNFKLPTGTSANLLFESTNATNTIENFDKGYPEKGDIVAVFAKSDEKGAVVKNLGHTASFFSIMTDGADDHDFYMGVNNTSRIDFYEPFNGTTYIAFDPSQLNKLYLMYKKNPKANEILGILGGLEEKITGSRMYNPTDKRAYRKTKGAFGN